MQNTYDVLICTPVLQAGQSLDKSINKVFSFFDLDILTHEMEHQMMLRARPWANMEPPVIYVEEGTAGSRGASYNEQRNAVGDVDNDELSLADAQADVLAERADSHNRHLELWGLDEYWQSLFPLVSPEDKKYAKVKWHKHFVNGRARTIRELFGDCGENHIPLDKQMEYEEHQMLMNKTGETCRYIEMAFGKEGDKKNNTSTKKSQIQRFRALGYLLCGIQTTGVSWML